MITANIQSRRLTSSISSPCFFAASCTALLLTAAALHAQPIAVPNYSFESQSGVGFPYETNPFLDAWQKIPEPPDYALLGSGAPPWYGTAGAFVNVSVYNPTPYGNVTGAQAGYILMAPHVTLFQDYTTSPAHDFNATYQVGKAYNLTIGVFAKSSFGNIVPGSTLELSLYYLDDANAKVKVGLTTISYDATTFALTPNLNLIDYQVTTPIVQAGDAWAGKNIGIQLESTIPLEMTSFGNWDFDNVRLTAVVPEPTAATLLGLGLSGLCLTRARRKG